jgi:hypothetical protein
MASVNVPKEHISKLVMNYLVTEVLDVVLALYPL